MSGSVLPFTTTKYKLGKNGQRSPSLMNTKGGAITETQGLAGPDARSQGESGFVPQVLKQYSFLKSSPWSQTNMKNPATRPMINAVNRQTKLRLDQLSNNIAATRKQLRTNEQTMSGTSIPKVTNFTWTTDYHRLIAPLETSNILQWVFGLIFVYLILTKLAR